MIKEIMNKEIMNKENMNRENTYTIVLTHDVDHISLRDYPFLSRYGLAFVKNAVFTNFLELLKGHIGIRTYIKSFCWGAAYPAVKMGVVKDPFEKCFQRILKIEKEYNVRSTFYFIPYKGNPGLRPDDSPAPANRAAAYDITRYKDLLVSLEEQGWEVGIHGINAHTGVGAAAEELEVFKRLLPSKEKWGIRMHWLYHRQQLWENLKEAGYYYDTTFGSNREVGFIENRFHPFQRDGLWVLPLNIQDGALLATWNQNLSQRQAWESIEPLLKLAKEKGAVVTILWHNASFGPPRFWEGLYRRIIEKGKEDGAQFLTALQAVEEVNTNG